MNSQQRAQLRERLLGLQGGVCAICKRHPGARPALDHCHATGKVRGVLCMRCNTAIGSLRDDPDVFLRALNYVRGDMTHLDVTKIADSVGQEVLRPPVVEKPQGPTKSLFLGMTEYRRRRRLGLAL